MQIIFIIEKGPSLTLENYSFLNKNLKLFSWKKFAKNMTRHTSLKKSESMGDH